MAKRLKRASRKGASRKGVSLKKLVNLARTTRGELKKLRKGTSPKEKDRELREHIDRDIEELKHLEDAVWCHGLFVS